MLLQRGRVLFRLMTRWRRCSLCIATVSVSIVVLVDAPAHTATKRWADGVSEATRIPLSGRQSPAVIPMGKLVAVFGGGSQGEDVSTKDGHDDGAILDVSTGRMARAPFKVVAPAGVWTGREIVFLGIAPTCSLNNGQRECRSGTLRAGVYSPSSDSWREIDVPRRLRKTGRGAVFTWTGTEAVFGTTALNPATGAFRTIPPPGGGVSEVGECVARDRIVVLERALSSDRRGVPGRVFVLDRKARHWSEIPPVGGEWSPFGSMEVVCTDTGVVVTTLNLTRVVFYDFETGQWVEVVTPERPDAVLCGPRVTTCDIFDNSGHGNVVDYWKRNASEPGFRYDTTTRMWSTIAPRPSDERGTLGAMVWTKGLGLRYGFDRSTPTTGDGELLVYRP